MPNRRNTSVPVSEFNPRPNLQTGGSSVPRPMGEADAALSSMAAQLSDKLGNYADQAAVAEGKRDGIIAGGEDGFKPTNSMTLRGQAFDAAAISTYADKLETNVRERSWEGFRAWSELPPDQQTLSNLEGVLGKVRSSFEGEVFPEVAGEFNKRFSALAGSFRKSAWETVEARTKDQARAALVDATNSATTGIARAVAIDAPPEVIEAEMNNATRKIDESAAAGHISQESAAKSKLAIVRDTRLRQALAPIEKAQTLTELNAAEIKHKETFRAGGPQSVDAETNDQVLAGIEQRRRAITAKSTQSAGLVKTTIGNVVERALAGFDIPQPEWLAIKTEAATTPEGQAAVELAEKKLLLVRALRGRSPAEIGSVATYQRSRLKDAGQGADRQQAELVTFVEEYEKKTREALATDPLGHASRNGLVEVAPLDFRRGDPAAMVPEILARGNAARATATVSNQEPTYFRPDEISALTDISIAGGERATAVAAAIVQGLGKEAPRALGELVNKAPGLAHLGQLLASGAVSAPEVARDSSEAMRLAKIAGATMPQIPTVTAAKVYNDEIGGGLAAHGETQQRVRATATRVWQTRVLRENVEPDSARSEEIYREAMQQAAGGSVVKGKSYGGVASYKPPDAWYQTTKVVVPPNIRADRFPDVIGALKDSDFDQARAEGITSTRPVDENGKPVPVATLRKAFLVYTSKGYRFAMGDPKSSDPKYIRSSGGGPFELNVGDYESILRARVPGAYLGGDDK